MTSDRTMSEPSTIRAATIGNAADDGSAGTTTPAPCNSGCPDSSILRPWLPSGVETICAPKCFSISSVWSRLASVSITVVIPGAASPASSTADLIWRGHRRAVQDRQRIARALQRQRQAAAFAAGHDPGAHQFQGIHNPPHRPGAQRGVAVEHGRDRAAGDSSHHQPAAGAGIAEIERICGCANPAAPTPRTTQANRRFAPPSRPTPASIWRY